MNRAAGTGVPGDGDDALPDSEDQAAPAPFLSVYSGQAPALVSAASTAAEQRAAREAAFPQMAPDAGRE